MKRVSDADRRSQLSGAACSWSVGPKRGAKAQPTDNSEGGMEYVAGQNIPLQGGDQLSPPILRDSRDARGNRATRPMVRPMVRRTASTQRREQERYPAALRGEPTYNPPTCRSKILMSVRGQ